MSDVVIRAEGLSKLYRLGEIGGTTLREDMQRWWQRARGREGAQDPRDHWALRDVSFEVKRGEVLGVIGRNGAGKSTLLKILSRTTAPTKGRALVKGRIGSLLEVGTGFHPELSGRENIYLNGAILGMKRREIDARLEEIIEFSGVEKFIDTPVKRYSSGMYVRLAFAVAAHLKPEILIVDEVLAVGDAEFQNKCINKMHEIGSSGRTVIFVSHNMPAVQSLCSAALLLKEGRTQKAGPLNEVIAEYNSSINALTGVPLIARNDRVGNGSLRFVAAAAESLSENAGGVLVSGAPAVFRLTVKVNEPIRKAHLAMNIYDQDGYVLLNFNTRDHGQDVDLDPGGACVEFRLPSMPLAAGSYRGNVYSASYGEALDWVQGAFSVVVEASDIHGTGHVAPQGKFVIPYTAHVNTEFDTAASE